MNFLYIFNVLAVSRSELLLPRAHRLLPGLNPLLAVPARKTRYIRGPAPFNKSPQRERHLNAQIAKNLHGRFITRALPAGTPPRRKQYFSILASGASFLYLTSLRSDSAFPATLFLKDIAET